MKQRAIESAVILMIMFHFIIALENSSFQVQTAVETVQEELVEKGFENVVVRQKSDELTIEYENRRYRNQISAIGVVLAIASDKEKTSETFHLIPKNRDIPLVTISTERKSYSDFMEGQISEETYADKIQITHHVSSPGEDHLFDYYQTSKANRSIWKLDLLLKPHVNMIFGGSPDKCLTELNLIPELSLSPITGMKISGMILLSVVDEISSWNKPVRPGRIVINQTFRLPQNLFFSATAGHFDLSNYGLSTELVWLTEKNLSLGFSSAYTGSYSYYEHVWEHLEMDNWTNLGRVSYKVPAWDFTASLDFGQFLYNDRGVRMNLSRDFGETTFGFFAYVTDEDKEGGFMIKFPISPVQKSSVGRCRINFPDSFTWTYRYSSTRSAKYLKNGNSIDSFMKTLYPSHIINNLKKIKQAKKFI